MGRKGIRAGAAYVELYANDNKLSRGLKTASVRIRAFGKMISGVGKKFLALGAAAAGPFVAAIKIAAAFEETMNKFNVVFGDNAKVVKAWGDQYAKQVGRSKKQIAEFLAEAQDLFIPLGFDEKGATEMSKQVSKLAVDLASFNNKADADVMRDLKAALTGSGEVMKKYGVIVSEAAVKQELLNTGLDPKYASNQEKATARLAIILKGTTAAQGDAVRSGGSFTNQMKALAAGASDAGAEIGMALLPVITPLVKDMVAAVRTAAEWITQNKALVIQIAKTAVVVAAVGAGLMALGVVVAIVSKVIGGLSFAVGILGKALTFLMAHPVIATLAAIVVVVGAVTAAFGFLAESIAEVSAKLQDLQAANDKQRATDKLRFERLKQLAAIEEKDADQKAESADLVKTLSDRYGDLGISIDRATGKLSGMADAQGKLNEGLKAAAIADTMAAMMELERNYENLRKKFNDPGWWSGRTNASKSAWQESDEGQDVKKQMAIVDQKLRAQAKRMIALGQGDATAVTGGAEGDAEKLKRKIAGGKAAAAAQTSAQRKAIAESEAAIKKLADLDERAADRKRNELEKELATIAKMAAERQKLLALIIAGEKAKGDAADQAKIFAMEMQQYDAGVQAEKDKAAARTTAAKEAHDEAEKTQAAELDKEIAAIDAHYDTVKAAEMEVAKLRIKATMKGHKQKMALLALEEKAEIAAAKASGLDVNTVKEKWRLRRQIANAGQGAGRTLSNVGTFNASRIGQMAGGSFARRTADAVEEMAEGVDRLVDKADAGELVLMVE